MSKLVFVGVAAAAILASSSVESAAGAQRYETGGIHNTCVSVVFDTSYGWATFRNTCSYGVSVTSCYRSAPYMCGELDVGARRAASTGDSRTDLNSHGGYELYVCRQNWIPVDASGEHIGSRAEAAANGLPFRCVNYD